MALSNHKFIITKLKSCAGEEQYSTFIWMAA